jgi:hypothetical protein
VQGRRQAEVGPVHRPRKALQSSIKEATMSSESKQLVRRLFLELWNQRKLAVADEIFAADYINHDPASPDFGKGPEGVKQTAKLYRNAFPDLLFTVDQMIDAGSIGHDAIHQPGHAQRGTARDSAHQQANQSRGHGGSPHFAWTDCRKLGYVGCAGDDAAIGDCAYLNKHAARINTPRASPAN